MTAGKACICALDPFCAVRFAVVGFRQEFHRHAGLIRFGHGIHIERNSHFLCIHLGNRCAKIRRKRLLFVQDVFHLIGDDADLPVDAIRYVIDGMAQVGVVVAQAFQAGKQADDAV